MASYVDGFILPVPKKNLDRYLKIAKMCSKIWIEHGALEYYECIADDVKPGKLTSFPQAVKLKASEIVFFSWITYKSRAHRDRVLKKVMADPRIKKMDMSVADHQRMIYGGFQTKIGVRSQPK